MGILTDDMQRVVREQLLGFVATVCADGTPNLSPKGTTAVWDEDHLVFADICSPQTMTNLRANPAVEVNVVDPLTRTGYRFKGRAEVHAGGPRFDEVVAFYEERGTDTARIRGIALIAVERAAALVSPAYDAGRRRDEIVDQHLRRFERIYGLRIQQRPE